MPTNTSTSGGDQYTGLDRFSRVDDQYWLNSSGGTVARYQYGYDADSNVLFRKDLVHTDASQLYGYDSLDRLTSFKVGMLATSNTAISGTPSTNESWTLDSLGNHLTDTVNGTTTTNTTDSQNRLTGVGSASQNFDANGNTLNGSNGSVYDYDAWNHMTTATVGSVTVAYSYDALGRRITSASTPASFPGSVVYMYDASGQVIETDTSDASGSVISQYVWGLGYVNDLVERNDNQYATATGSTVTLDRTLYAIHDANWDVTAITDSSSGDVLQWFGYGAYGTQYVFSSSYASTTDGYDWQIGFQGGMKDPATGLVHFEARDMNPATGTWMTQEPGGPAYVDGGNLYQTIESNPIGYSDPSGELTIGTHGIGADQGRPKYPSIFKGFQEGWGADSQQAMIQFNYGPAGATDPLKEMTSLPTQLQKDAAADLASLIKLLLDWKNKHPDCNEPIFLFGYSNGADVIHDALADLGGASMIKGVVLAGSAFPQFKTWGNVIGPQMLTNYSSPADRGSIAPMGAGHFGLSESELKNHPNLIDRTIGGIQHTSDNLPAGSYASNSLTNDGRQEWMSRYMASHYYGVDTRCKEHCLSDAIANGSIPGFNQVQDKLLSATDRLFAFESAHENKATTKPE